MLADAHGTVHTLRVHRFLPGFGGISWRAQPELAGSWLKHGAHGLTGVSRFLLEHEVPILALLMAPFALVVLVRRPPPTVAAALLWAALVVCNPGFEFEFVVWALPFALMAGWIRRVAAVQAALFVPAAIL